MGLGSGLGDLVEERLWGISGDHIGITMALCKGSNSGILRGGQSNPNYLRLSNNDTRFVRAFFWKGLYLGLQVGF